MLQHNSDGALVPTRALIETVPPAPVAGFHSIDMREILRILRRHVRGIALVAAAMLALALAFIATVTPLYTATSTVLIDPRRATVVDTTNPVLTNFGTDDATIESQVSLLQSLSVMQRVVDTLKLAEDPEFAPPPSILDRIRSIFSSSPKSGASAEAVARFRAIDTLQRRLKVIRQRSTFLVDINANSRDREKAATIANTVAEAYFVEQVRSKHDATKIAAGWLNNQISELRSRVIASDKAVQDFRAKNNLLVTQGVTVNDQQITDLNTKLVQARAETAEARAKFDQVKEVAENGRDSGSLNEAMQSETIARLRAQYADLAKTSADLSTKFGSRHPQVATVRAQLNETRKLIREEIRRVLEARQHSYEVAAAREKSLQKSLDDLQGISSDSNQAQVRLRELQREAEANRTIYESFLARYREASAQESLVMPESRVVTTADAPLAPSFPKIPLTLGLALVLGVAVGCVYALIADYLDRRIKTSEQAKLFGLPNIAAIPEVSARELAHLAKRGRAELEHYDPRLTRLLPTGLQPPLLRYAITHPMSAFAEAIRSIRFALQHATQVRKTQVVSITSAVSGEGKTTVATNLAQSLAVLGIKTALVEGDLRNPQLSRSLCPGAKKGLVDVALGGMPLNQAVLVDPSSKLAILPAPLPRDVGILTEFASSEGMSDMLAQLREHFDIVIVDAPPLLPLVDARALAEQSDAIVLTIGWDHTPQNVFQRAVELLDPVLDRVAGTVLTRVDLGRLKLYEGYDSNTYAAPYVYSPPPREAVR